MIIEQLQADFQVFALSRLSNGTHKQRHKPSQAVLVHGVDVAQVSHAEVQDRGMVGHRLVACPAGVDLVLCLICNLLLLRDLISQHLGALEHIDCFLILQPPGFTISACTNVAQKALLLALQLLEGYTWCFKGVFSHLAYSKSNSQVQSLLS